MTLAGLLLLVVSVLFGELHFGELPPFPRVGKEAALAILYLAIPGSVIAFTAYIWLLDRLPASTVGSYAYVNPVVALTLGWWLGNKTFDLRVLAGTLLVLLAVVLSLRGSRAHRSPGIPAGRRRRSLSR